jgi:hypothetical protein
VFPLLSLLAVADIISSPNECNVVEIREQVETLASLMSGSENRDTVRFSTSTDSIVISSGQTLCSHSTADAEEEHETEDELHVSLSANPARVISAQSPK